MGFPPKTNIVDAMLTNNVKFACYIPLMSLVVSYSWVPPSKKCIVVFVCFCFNKRFLLYVFMYEIGVGGYVHVHTGAYGGQRHWSKERTISTHSPAPPFSLSHTHTHEYFSYLIGMSFIYSFLLHKSRNNSCKLFMSISLKMSRIFLTI